MGSSKMAPQTVQIWGSVQVASGPGVWPVASLASRRVRPQRVQVYWMTPRAVAGRAGDLFPFIPGVAQGIGVVGDEGAAAAFTDVECDAASFTAGGVTRAS